MSASALDRWIKQSQNSGTFTEKANRTPEEKELITLRKENQRLTLLEDPDYAECLLMNREQVSNRG
ncbi:hypothetical protein NSU08_36300 [Paenibacillus sp. FSL H7-0331]|uniref:hypothetical protein n=1 Tax=Paenibacillus sp. FSL H7-0331 TaxID=1920421 RepID=UPI00096DB1D9|nr:hypothetical protein [Paenibacillus sp. FSL H7-0331]